MRWWWMLGLLACTPESSMFIEVDEGAASDAQPPVDAEPDLTTVDAAPLDGAVDMALDMIFDADVDLAVDMGTDMAPDLAVDAASDASVDMALIDMAPIDLAVDEGAADLAVDMTPDMAVDAVIDMAPLDGPLCGSARRLPFDGVLGLFGPVDIADYQGCNRVGGAWSAFIELDAPRTVIIKPGTGFVQRGLDCRMGGGECLTGPQRFELPAGRSDFVFISTGQVRVVSTPHCDNGADDDADGLVDLDDPGCARLDDPSESNPPAVDPPCSNGLDDDGDERADWPFDLGCPSPGSAVEACPGIAPDAVTSTTPERLDLRGIAGRPQALTCADAADLVEVLLVAPFSGRVEVSADPIGVQALEARRGCDDVTACLVGSARTELAVSTGDVVRVRLHGRPEWLSWRMSAPLACGNGLDDDGDGRVDLADPGCRSIDDVTEADPPAPEVCSNGIDDDRDRATDYPEELACRGPGGETEVDACAVASAREVGDPEHWVPREVVAGACGGALTSEVGLTYAFRRPHFVRVARGLAHARLDCADPGSAVGCVEDGGVLGPLDGDATVYLEAGAVLATPAVVSVRRCANGVDDDGDDLIDLDDPGCTDPLDDDETDPDAPAACGDGVDNDGDGRTDWPADPECFGAGDPAEAARCANIPDVAPLERLTVLGGFEDLPITESLDDGRRVRAVVIPFLIDRPGRRVFEGNAEVNWIPLRDCAPIPDGQGFGSTRVVDADANELLVRLEVDAERRHPLIRFGATTPDCRNQLDDDGDGLVDSDDPGCARQPSTEVEPPEPPACADAVDNDGDGLIDAEDPQCLGVNDLYEGGVCPDDLTLAPVTASAERWVFPDGSPRFGLPCGPGTLQRSAVLPLVLDRAARVIVRTAEARGDPVLTLEQDCQRPIACGDDGAPHLQAEVVAFLEAGRYAIRVGRWQTDEVEPIRVNITIE